MQEKHEFSSLDFLSCNVEGYRWPVIGPGDILGSCHARHLSGVSRVFTIADPRIGASLQPQPRATTILAQAESQLWTS